MVILRSKHFAEPQNVDKSSSLYNNNPKEQVSQEVTSRDLQVEQMKQQRQLLQTQRMRQKLQAQERMDRMRQLQKAQKDKMEEKENQKKSLLQAKKSEQLDGAKNVSLYKTRSTTIAPVPMGK